MPTTPRQVALITGSGKRRIGSVVADALAQRGFDIVLHYNRSVAEAEETAAMLRGYGGDVITVQANVADESQVAGMFARVMERFGRLDVLVTAAAVWEPKPLDETTAADVRRQFDINALGTFLCCQQAGRIMAGQSEGGLIVTIGDWATVRPYPGYAAYFAGKGSISTMTRVLAVELAEKNRNIRVNSILPGPVMLPENLSQPEVAGAVAGTLLKRPGKPENVAQAVLFFIDCDYTTGVCLPVDGGRTIAGGR